MKRLATLTTAVFIAASAPALAGGIVFDFPHLTYPPTQPDVTRGCPAATPGVSEMPCATSTQ